MGLYKVSCLWYNSAKCYRFVQLEVWNSLVDRNTISCPSVTRMVPMKRHQGRSIMKALTQEYSMNSSVFLFSHYTNDKPTKQWQCGLPANLINTVSLVGDLLIIISYVQKTGHTMCACDKNAYWQWGMQGHQLSVAREFEVCVIT